MDARSFGVRQKKAVAAVVICSFAPSAARISPWRAWVSRASGWARSWSGSPLSPASAACWFISAFMYIKTRAASSIISALRETAIFLSELVGTEVPAIVPWEHSLGERNGDSRLLVWPPSAHVARSKWRNQRHDVRPCGMGADGPDFLSSDRAGSVCRESGVGIAPAAMSLVMLMTYSVVVGAVYMALDGLNSKSEAAGWSIPVIEQAKKSRLRCSSFLSRPCRAA